MNLLRQLVKTAVSLFACDVDSVVVIAADGCVVIGLMSTANARCEVRARDAMRDTTCAPTWRLDWRPLGTHQLDCFGEQLLKLFGLRGAFQATSAKAFLLSEQSQWCQGNCLAVCLTESLLCICWWGDKHTMVGAGKAFCAKRLRQFRECSGTAHCFWLAAKSAPASQFAQHFSVLSTY